MCRKFTLNTFPITQVAVGVIKKEVAAAFPAGLSALRTEMQDGGQFLLVVIEVRNSLSRQDLEKIVQIGGGLLEKRVPRRLEECSWIPDVHQHGTLIDSVAGGWGENK